MASLTKPQRQIVRTWAALAALLLAVAVFESWILAQWSWLRFVALVVIVAGALASKPASRDPERLNRAVERYPLLKLWFVICALAALGFFAVTSVWHVPLNENIGPAGLMVIFLVLLGPPVAAIERERFEVAGKLTAERAS